MERRKQRDKYYGARSKRPGHKEWTEIQEKYTTSQNGVTIEKDQLEEGAGRGKSAGTGMEREGKND